MSLRYCKRLIAPILAAVLALTLCACIPMGLPNGPSDGSDQALSDHAKYARYLNGLVGERQELSDGFSYTAIARPVQAEEETCIELSSVKDGKSGPADKEYDSIAITLLIPDGGKGTKFSFSYSTVKADGTRDLLVQASCVLDTAVYQGELSGFTAYKNNETVETGDEPRDEGYYLGIANEELKFLLRAATAMLDVADLDLSALGFTYEVAPLGAEETTAPTT